MDVILNTRANPAEFVQGPLVVVFCLNVFLFGVITTQIYEYFYTYSKKDRLSIQIFVAALYSSHTLSVVFFMVYLYRILITFYGHFDMLIRTHWSLTSQSVFGGLMAMSVQLFFARRVYVLTNSRICGGFIAAIALTLGAMVFSATYQMSRRATFSEFYQFKTTMTMSIVTQVLGDIAITTILVTYLRRHKSGLPHSDMMVDRIIRVTMQTGLLTAVIAVAYFIAYLLKNTVAQPILGGTLTGLQLASLLANLNSRKGLRLQYGIDTALSGPEIQFAPQKTDATFDMGTRPQALGPQFPSLDPRAHSTQSPSKVSADF